MKTTLTDRALRAMKPAPLGTRKMVWDAAVPSFGVRVTDKGKLTFIVMRRLHGKIVRRMIGQYPIMTLSKAREGGLEALRDFERGILTRKKRKPPLAPRTRTGGPIPLPPSPMNLSPVTWPSFAPPQRSRRRSGGS
jgi:Arm DNA-binding domain